MSSRYTLTLLASQIRDRFKVEVSNDYKPRYNAAPSQELPIITSSNPHGFSFFFWGVNPRWSKDKAISTKLYTVTANQINTKKRLSTLLNNNRCLVPADGYYDWKLIGRKTKIPHRIIINGGEPFSFAGIWEEDEDFSGNQTFTFKVIVKEASSKLTMFRERMPVIFTPTEEKIWLDPLTKEEDLINLINEDRPLYISSYPVSSLVNSVHSDRPEMVKQMPPSDQFGNYTLFD